MVERRREQRTPKRRAPAEPEKKTEQVRPILACSFCGKSFRRGHPQQRYCDPTCRERASSVRQWERERAAQASAHPLAARYPLGEEDPHGPVIDLDTFRERFAWPYSNSTRRAIAIRAAELLGTDQESVERAIARLSGNSAAEKYVRSISHATAEALLIGARGDFWGLPAFPVTGTTAREMAETSAELHDPEMSEYDRIELAHRLARFAHGYLNADETLANLKHEGTSDAPNLLAA